MCTVCSLPCQVQVNSIRIGNRTEDRDVKTSRRTHTCWLVWLIFLGVILVAKHQAAWCFGRTALKQRNSFARTLDYCDDGECRAVVDTGRNWQKYKEMKKVEHMWAQWKVPWKVLNNWTRRDETLLGTSLLAVLLFHFEARNFPACSPWRLCRATSAGLSEAFSSSQHSTALQTVNDTWDIQ